jgi:transposase-like protein
MSESIIASLRKKNNIEREERRRAAGLYACSHTVKETSRFFGLSKNSVKYWKAKILDADLHAGELGGSRNQKWNP